MKRLFATMAMVFAAGPAATQVCNFHSVEPVHHSGKVQYRFVDSCGAVYEVGYRLEGNTLHFPRGGQHALPEVTASVAEQVLRETYGLVGETDALIRTKGF